LAERKRGKKLNYPSFIEIVCELVNLQQHACKVRVVEFKMSLVVELEKSRTVGVVLLQVDVVQLWFLGGETTIFTNIHLKKRELNVETILLELDRNI
jgi:hypothetical protein